MSEITTYTKKWFDPLKPDVDLIDIVDIAHALSMLCRANGHFRTFYSVAQHSINCMQEAVARGCSKRVQLACLLHDASEAYLSDITRPVKKALPKYLEIEKPLQKAIWEKWLSEPLNEKEKKQVFQIDDTMLYHEFVEMMGIRLGEEEPKLYSKPVFTFEGFEQTEQRFLRCFELLNGEKETFFTVGIDWMKPYWLAVEIRGSELKYRCFRDIGEVCSAYRDADAILIDIPIGLPECREEAVCPPDLQARKYLKGQRKSSVFNVLFRQVVNAKTVEEAWEINRKLDAKLTSPGLALRPMVRQVDEFLRQNPEWKNRLLESHPEVAFQKLNWDKGLEYSKHTAEGIIERCSILQRYGIQAQLLLKEFKTKEQEDVLDAMCLALSAQLGCQNGFCTIPEDPVCDRYGLKMQMTFGMPMKG